MSILTTERRFITAVAAVYLTVTELLLNDTASVTAAILARQTL